jgi:FMN phosphatase YigB (HAD superfamily)
MTKNPTDYANPRAVLFDLDSTLFDVQHREHLAPVGPNRADVDMWIDYSKGCIDDTVVEGVAKAARMFYAAGYLIFIVSGRNIEARDETEAVMRRNNVPFHEIRLHTANDLRHNGEYKSQYINELKVRGITPELMFEDHISVCEMIEERTGVPCVSVKPRYEDNIGVSFNLNQYPDLAAL